MKRVFKDKWSKVIIKSSKSRGYLASIYLFDGTYAGCTHLEANEVDDYIKYVLSDYTEIL